MNVWEKVIEKMVREKIAVSINQFGFIPEKSTIELIFSMWQLIKNYKEKKRNVAMVFIDLEKVHGRVLKDAFCKVLKKKMVPTVYVKIIQVLYDEARMSVKCMCKETEDFKVKVCV